MTEEAEEAVDPATITRPARIGSDGRAAETYPEPFPAEEPPINNKQDK